MDPAAPIPAATLVIFRETGGAAELLFMERAGGMAFAAGALVFPGGRVDPGDREIATGYPMLEADDAAARVAAIRETLEESGLSLGFDPPIDAETRIALRGALAAGEAFGDLLARGGWRLDLDLLQPWARWCPNFRETRNFDTRFYIARLPDDAGEATVDETENVHLFWATPADVLARANCGEAMVIFPTRRNLERLALFDGFAATAAHAAAIPVRLVQPWIEERDDGQHLCIPDDLGYPVISEKLARVRRG